MAHIFNNDVWNKKCHYPWSMLTLKQRMLCWTFHRYLCLTLRGTQFLKMLRSKSSQCERLKGSLHKDLLKCLHVLVSATYLDLLLNQVSRSSCPFPLPFLWSSCRFYQEVCNHQICWITEASLPASLFRVERWCGGYQTGLCKACQGLPRLLVGTAGQISRYSVMCKVYCPKRSEL